MIVRTLRSRLVATLLLTTCLSLNLPSQQISPEALQAYTAKREIALAPVLQFMHHDDYVAARTALQPLLADYPHDLRVLLLAADTARITGNFDQALTLYRESLANRLATAGAIHLGLIRTYADMGQWADFNKERALVRQLALAGDPTLSLERGYVIEDHRAQSLHLQVLEFASTDPSAITRFRFLFLSDRSGAAHFTPSIDLESNPADAPSFARQYPQMADAHVRLFALASYPDPHTRGFLKFYADGEPAYEDVRNDVLAATPTMAPLPLPSDGPQHRTPYQPPPH